MYRSIKDKLAYIFTYGNDPDIRDSASYLYKENNNFPKIIFNKNSYNTSKIEIIDNVYCCNKYYDIELHGIIYGLYTVAEQYRKIPGSHVHDMVHKMASINYEKMKNKKVRIFEHPIY